MSKVEFAYEDRPLHSFTRSITHPKNKVISQHNSPINDTTNADFKKFEVSGGWHDELSENHDKTPGDIYASMATLIDQNENCAEAARTKNEDSLCLVVTVWLLNTQTIRTKW